ncbi:hypothetical protein [Bradyrhizobium japonicum]|uniref:hypothetical protein n=1 Tax=Bradyrhizobium japonicum TaxID=375 RepID=UPI0005761324|nr:hypothetical protein [Bradyrhizobium japonicum]
MSRGTHSFKQGDLTKALKGMVKAGVPLARVEIGVDGKIVLFAGQPEGHPSINPGSDNEWDAVK